MEKKNIYFHNVSFIRSFEHAAVFSACIIQWLQIMEKKWIFSVKNVEIEIRIKVCAIVWLVQYNN